MASATSAVAASAGLSCRRRTSMNVTSATWLRSRARAVEESEAARQHVSEERGYEKSDAERDDDRAERRERRRHFFERVPRHDLEPHAQHRQDRAGLCRPEDPAEWRADRAWSIDGNRARLQEPPAGRRLDCLLYTS